MNTLRSVRKAQGLTMKQLGELVGLTESAISCYELGKREPDFATLQKLADALLRRVSGVRAPAGA